jgi:hypothetical protein
LGSPSRRLRPVSGGVAATRPRPIEPCGASPVQILTAAERGWHAGPWKPSWRYSESDPNRLLVFFDGSYRKDEPRGFPFAFTLGCLETDRPASG